MTTSHKKGRRRFRRRHRPSGKMIVIFAVCIFLGLFLSKSQAQGFLEVPYTLYGKVIHVGIGTSYQLFSGELTIRLRHESNLENQVSFSASLRPTG